MQTKPDENPASTNNNSRMDDIDPTSSQAVSCVEYILSILRDEPCNNAMDYLHATTAKTQQDQSKEGVNPATAHMQVTIDALCDATIGCLIQLKEDLAVQYQSRQPESMSVFAKTKKYTTYPITNPLSIRLYGDHIIDSESFQNILQSPALNVDVRRIVLELFVSTAVPAHPITRLLQLSAAFNIHGFEWGSDSEVNKAFSFPDTGVKTVEHITASMIKNAYIASIFSIIIKESLPETLSAIRVKKNHVDLILNSGESSDDIHHVNKDGSETRYYNVYYNSFTNNELVGRGTMPVRWNGMFRQGVLQSMMAMYVNADQTLVVDWQEFSCESDYNDFNDF